MTWTITRQVAFYPAENYHGKWHAARLISRIPACGARLTLSTRDVVRTAAGQDSSQIHPIICRTCLRMTTNKNETSPGVEQ